MSDIEFVDGLIFKLPRDNAPDFVKGSLSIKREELIGFLQNKQDEWVNIDLKVSKAGKAYASVDNFKPKPQAGGGPASSDDGFSNDIPFNSIT